MYLSEDAVKFAANYPEITRNPKFQQLLAVPRHGSTNTYDHSVRVAYMAYQLAPSMGVNQDSAVKVGLLHDFCLIDYHKVEKDNGHNGRWYCFYHPEDAVENSILEGFELSKKEKKAIYTHMFPLSTGIPTSRLGYLLTLCDKTVALQESFANAVEGYVRFKLFVNGGRLKAVRVIRRNTYDRFFDGK